MRILTIFAAAAAFAAPALAQQGTVHDPFRRPSAAESRIDRSFERQQDDAARLRTETRDDIRRGRDDRDPARGTPPPRSDQDRRGSRH
jgi:hypothetical protein